ncbi:MAG: hypothetical protein LBE13_16070, partial [Bacteroidales bacterium]|nr:hypothetical protein [Bacteroidales bacterium]
EELAKRASEFKNTMPWLQNNIDILNKYEEEFSTDEKIRESSQMREFIIILILTICDCYTYDIEHLQIISHIFNLMTDFE